MGFLESDQSMGKVADSFVEGVCQPSSSSFRNGKSDDPASERYGYEAWSGQR